MAQLALGIAGAVVGSFFGSPQIGFIIGSTLGGLLFPEKVEYPALEDLKLQDSTYGRPIPMIFGTMRVAGNVIWQTPELKKHKQKSGGKGGPEITSYTYSASWAVAWCGNEILGYRRKWAAGKIVYDDTSSSSDQLQFTKYFGTETQLPDPTMEAVLGAGEVTGHRGTAYTVYDDVYLTDYGNAIPLLEAEVYTGAGAIPWRVTVVDLWQGIAGTLSNRCATFANGAITASTYDQAGHVFYTNVFSDIYGTLDGAYGTGGTSASVYSIKNLNSILHSEGETAHWYTWNASISAWEQGFAAAPECYVAPTLVQGNASVYMDNIVYTASGSYSGKSVIGRWSAIGGVPTLGIATGYFTLDAVYATSTIGLGTSDTGHLYVMVGSSGTVKMWKFHPDGTQVHFWDATDTSGTFLAARGNFHVYKGNICFAYRTLGLDYVKLVKINDDNTLEDYGNTIASSVNNDLGIGCLEGGLMFDQTGVFSLDPPAAPAILGDIVAAIAAKGGDTPDVSALPDLVDGYILNASMSCKAAIDGLRSTYSFDGAEVDDQVIFVKRGGASVATITIDDLAAHEYGSEAGPRLKRVRTPDAELPRSVTVRFINAARDYQIDSQYDRREVTSSILDATYDLPINMTAGKARATAKKLLYEAWIERDRYTFSTHRQYATLVPTDVVTVDGITMRIEKKTEAPNGIFTFEAVATLAEIYTQSEADGIGGSFTPQPPPVDKADTTLVLLDLPLLTDADEANGLYVAMGPADSGAWSGATLYKSADGGVTYTDVVSTSDPAVIGTVASALGDSAGGNMFDESNVITVVLTSADSELESATETAVLSGANPCAIGREVLQFRAATLTAPNTYQLSGLLRGRRGTEWAMNGHSAAEQFVLLPVLDAAAPLGDLGASRMYKAVGFGKSLASAPAQTFTNQGMRLKPYSPVHIGGGSDDSLDVTINWTYRARTGGAWLDLVDVSVPSGTTTIVEIRNSSYTQVARVITVTGGAQTCAYSAADQITDFGAEQATVYCTISVLGSYGLGTRGRGVIDGGGATVDEPVAPVSPYGSAPGPAPGPTNPVNFTLLWNGSNSPHVTTGHVIGDTYVVEFTTDSDPVGPGNIQAAEYGNPAYYRTAIIATDTGGVNQVAIRYGNTVDFIFGTGSGKVSLSPTTTYYLIVRAQLPDGTPSSPLGSPANMIISF